MKSKIIEFIGMGRAGKTTQINLTKQKLEQKGYSVKIITDRERAEKLNIPHTELIGYKIVFAAKALDELFKHKNKYDYILIGRGFNDAIVWFDAEEELGNIPTERTNELRNTFLEYANQVDKIVCLLVSLEEAKQRQQQLTQENQDKFEKFIVGEYAVALRNNYLKNKDSFENKLYIDGTFSIEEVSDKIITYILE